MWCSGLSINRAKNFKKQVFLESESGFFSKKLGKKSCQACRPLLALVQRHLVLCLSFARPFQYKAQIQKSRVAVSLLPSFALHKSQATAQNKPRVLM